MKNIIQIVRDGKIWPIWCKTLGNKISEHKPEADFAAILRTAWVILQVITCLCIIFGVGINFINVIHHW
jgi:hypothetical protein